MIAIESEGQRAKVEGQRAKGEGQRAKGEGQRSNYRAVSAKAHSPG